MGVFPIMGKDATKSEFLKQLRESSVIHVATYGSFDKGIEHASLLSIAVPVNRQNLFEEAK